jgi:hypothetical protein
LPLRYSRDYYLAHRDKILQRERNWRKNNRSRAKGHKLKQVYGMTTAEFDMLLRLQNDKCAACGHSFGSRGPFVDHDHLTGRVRGLLCLNCNSILGHAKDDPEILKKAVEYLCLSESL